MRRRTTFLLPGGVEVVPGTEHWEFPTVGGNFSEEQLQWFQRSGIGLRGPGIHPAQGRPWWDMLLPYESGD